MTKNFVNVNCIEELKKQYFALAKKYHSESRSASTAKHSAGCLKLTEA